MTLKREKNVPPNPFQDNPPAGATRKAFDREDNGGGPPGSPLGDRHAAEDMVDGGTETGGLAGSNMGDGTPVSEQDLEAEKREEANGPFAGPTGGAVGGTPAEGRASGGHMMGKGFSPGSGSSRGDSTIGSKPRATKKTPNRRKKK
jgi:hypothetical protein